MTLRRCSICDKQTPTDGVFCLICGTVRKGPRPKMIRTGVEPRAPHGQRAYEARKRLQPGQLGSELRQAQAMTREHLW